MIQHAFFGLNITLVYGGFLLMPSDQVSGATAIMLGWFLGMLAYVEEVNDDIS